MQAPAGNPSFGGRPFAGFGYRVASFLLDAGVPLAAGVAAAVAAGGKEEWQSGGGDTVLVLTAIVVWFLVTSVAMGVFRGQSLGKKLVGTRVVQVGGTPAGFGTSLLRDQLARLLYFVPLFALLDVIWAAASDQKQTLRDKMTSTYVVRESRRRRRGPGAWRSRRRPAWRSGSRAPRRWTRAPVTSRARATATWTGGRSWACARTTAAATNECVCLYEHISSRVSYDEYSEAGRSENPDDWPQRVQDATVAANEICVN